MIISYLKKYLFLIVLAGIVPLFGTNLNPFDNTTFIVHDETQAARVIEFVFNLQEGKFPPRISPHMSFGLGYPIFNYYAPFAYWVTSGFYLLGMNVASALELSYLLAICTAFIGMYFFLKTLFNEYASVAGSLAYVSSPFIAVDIFVRGNLAELWFFALFPLALYLITTLNSKKLFFTVLTISFVFTSHNIFSLVSIPLLLGYSLLQKNKISIIAVVLGLLISSYFLLPMIYELKEVQASNIATITQYQDHFLCPSQLWYSPWGFGGSTAGCVNDGMSFMLGKIQILLGLAGFGYFVHQLYKKKLKDQVLLKIGVAIIFLGSLFMTISASGFLWKTFEPLLSIFQFPWRFLLFVIFGLAFFTAYLIQNAPKKLQFMALIGVVAAIFFFNPKFFKGNEVETKTYIEDYTSKEYIRNVAAFKVAEYLPKSADYEYWRSLENKENLDLSIPVTNQKGQEIQVLRNKSFEKVFLARSNENILLNIHYTPYWIIMRETDEIKPTKFDPLGRPTVDVSSGQFETLTIKYRQTFIQKLANLITLLTGIIVLIYSSTYIRWHKKKI